MESAAVDEVVVALAVTVTGAVAVAVTLRGREQVCELGQVVIWWNKGPLPLVSMT